MNINNIIALICYKLPSLKHKNYRFFLYGQSISMIGTWMQKTALQWVIYEITKSPFILSLVGVFQFTPMLLFSLFAGVFVDRFPKKTFLLVTQTLSMLQSFILAALLFLGFDNHWYILVLSGLFGVINAFDMPARQSFFIELVGKEDLPNAIGLNSMNVNLSKIIGPAVAAIFISNFGSSACFFLNGLSFIAVIISLLNIKSYKVNIRKQENDILKEIKDGLSYIFKNNLLCYPVLAMLIVGGIGFNTEIIIPVLVKEIFHRNVESYSVMLSAMGLGSLIGSLVFAVRKREKIGSHTLFQNAILLSLFLVITGLLNNYFLSLISIVLIGCFSMIFMTTVNTTIQLNSSDKYRGRVMSVYALVLAGSSPMGNFFTGIIMDTYSPSACFIVEGILTSSLIIILILIMLKKDFTTNDEILNKSNIYFNK